MMAGAMMPIRLSPDQAILRASYLLHLRQGPAFLRRVLLWDIQAALDIGAEKLIDDLHAVLHQFQIDYSGAFGAPLPGDGKPTCNA
jgi:hypothetical protein